ncbi:MAG: hypothetical protein HY907_11715 [Deltaproteobacteria bacterium]|nr:hypothetical protein [Deltaproteobacteria bacterium]
MKLLAGVAASMLLLVGPGCTKRQILPATIAGVGGATMVGGFVYSATLPEGSGFFGSDAVDSAAIGGLIFGGVALAVTGVLFSITSADCESDDDCWSGDRCELESRTCVAEETIEPPPAQPEPGAGNPDPNRGLQPAADASEPAAP